MSLRSKIFKLFVLNYFLFVSLFALGQNVPDGFKRTVVFIFIKTADDSIVPNGTGFFVSKADSVHKRTFVYLITAKHVIQNNITKDFFDEIYIRINRKGKDFDTIPLRLVEEKGIHFVVDENPNVDLAVIPLAPDISKYDYLSIPEEFLFESKEKFDSSYVSEGTNIFYLGLFSPYLGYNSNKPIVRFGRVALLPTEDIYWDSSTSRENLFLVETTTYGGNSGSPMFSYYVPQQIGQGLIVGQDTIRLIGVVKGYAGEKTPVEYIASSMNLMYTSNVGITAVIPSYFIYKIIESPILLNVRKNTP